MLIKTAADLSWQEDQRTFHMLGRDGLYLRRSHEFSWSCVPALRRPSELEEQYGEGRGT